MEMEICAVQWAVDLGKNFTYYILNADCCLPCSRRWTSNVRMFFCCFDSQLYLDILKMHLYTRMKRPVSSVHKCVCIFVSWFTCTCVRVYSVVSGELVLLSKSTSLLENPSNLQQEVHKLAVARITSCAETSNREIVWQLYMIDTDCFCVKRTMTFALFCDYKIGHINIDFLLDFGLIYHDINSSCWYFTIFVSIDCIEYSS